MTKIKKRRYIGGSTKDARKLLWKSDPVLSNAVDSVSNAYGLYDGALRYRMDHEGFTDRAINLINKASADNQDLYYGHNLLRNKRDFSGVGDFGLDDASTMINDGRMLLINENWYDESGINEKGRATNGAVGDTLLDTIGLQASALKYFTDEARKDNPGLSDYDVARYGLAYYTRGVEGGRKWVKNGAKGYDFNITPKVNTEPMIMRQPKQIYPIKTTVQSTAAPTFGSYKDGKLPGFRGGKENDDPFEIKKQGKLISAAVNRNVYGNKTELNKKHDEVIAKKKAYGWKNAMRTPIHNARQAAELINPAWGFHDIIPALWSRFVSPTDMKGSTLDDKAFWKRHIGFERDLESMPITGIRFSGDYNEDGSLRLPEAEYTGLSKLAKDFIRAGIENRKLIPKRNGVWTQIHESGLNPGTTRFNPYSKYTSHLGDYSIRENNDSGIYDVVDTYDFPMLYPVFNRQDGKQIEIRDTIHTKNAVPELYDPMFSATFPKYSNGKSIHINPANRGKFNATKKRTGKTTEELAHSKNPLTRKRAIFALNARKWKH